MFKMFDFQCDRCGHRFEQMVDAGPEGLREAVSCPACPSSAALPPLPNAARKFEVIAVLKKNKAGHVHKFANRPAEKISVSVPAKIGS